MNNHLSEEQFARYFVVGSARVSKEEHQHLLECAKCRDELDGFGNMVSSLRDTIGGQVDARVESQPGAGIPVFIQATHQGMPRMRRALAAAAVILLGMVPFLTSEKPRTVNEEVSAYKDPDTLMKAINLHLSRAVPSPMEPMMSLLPSDESITESGGVQ